MAVDIEIFVKCITLKRNFAIFELTGMLSMTLKKNSKEYLIAPSKEKITTNFSVSVTKHFAVKLGCCICKRSHREEWKNWLIHLMY